MINEILSIDLTIIRKWLDDSNIRGWFKFDRNNENNQSYVFYSNELVIMVDICGDNCIELIYSLKFANILSVNEWVYEDLSSLEGCIVVQTENFIYFYHKDIESHCIKYQFKIKNLFVLGNKLLIEKESARGSNNVFYYIDHPNSDLFPVMIQTAVNKFEPLGHHYSIAECDGSIILCKDIKNGRIALFECQRINEETSSALSNIRYHLRTSSSISNVFTINQHHSPAEDKESLDFNQSFIDSLLYSGEQAKFNSSNLLQQKLNSSKFINSANISKISMFSRFCDESHLSSLRNSTMNSLNKSANHEIEDDVNCDNRYLKVPDIYFKQQNIPIPISPDYSGVLSCSQPNVKGIRRILISDISQNSTIFFHTSIKKSSYPSLTQVYQADKSFSNFVSFEYFEFAISISDNNLYCYNDFSNKYSIIHSFADKINEFKSYNRFLMTMTDNNFKLFEFDIPSVDPLSKKLLDILIKQLDLSDWNNFVFSLHLMILNSRNESHRIISTLLELILHFFKIKAIEGLSQYSDVSIVVEERNNKFNAILRDLANTCYFYYIKTSIKVNDNYLLSIITPFIGYLLLHLNEHQASNYFTNQMPISPHKIKEKHNNGSNNYYKSIEQILEEKIANINSNNVEVSDSLKYFMKILYKYFEKRLLLPPFSTLFLIVTDRKKKKIIEPQIKNSDFLIPKIDPTNFFANIDYDYIMLKFPNDNRADDIQQYFDIFKPLTINVSKLNMADSESFQTEAYTMCVNSYSQRVARLLGLSIFVAYSNNDLNLSMGHLKIPRDVTLEPIKQIVEINPDTLNKNNGNNWMLYELGFLHGLSSKQTEIFIKDIINVNKQLFCNNPYLSGCLLGAGLNKFEIFDKLTLHNLLMICDVFLNLSILLILALNKKERLEQIRDTGIFRVFLGIQSSFKDDVAYLTDLELLFSIFASAITGIGFNNFITFDQLKEFLLKFSVLPTNSFNSSDLPIGNEAIATVWGLSMGLAYFDEIYKTSSDLQKTIIETVHRLIHPSNVDLGTEKIPTVYNPRQKSCSSITTIGGMILLGLAFFDTKNKSAVQILEFDKELGDMSVRPDFATFLILSKSLINWSLVEATQEWIDDQIPKIIKSQAFKPHDINSPNGMNRFYINKIWCHYVIGISLTIGLKFCGTHDQRILNLLEQNFQDIEIIESNREAMQCTDPDLLMECFSCLSLAMSLIMCGSCSYNVTKYCMKSVYYAQSKPLIYKIEYINSLCLGILFMSAGKSVFYNDNKSIAKLLCIVFPKFPSFPGDNETYMNIFRIIFPNIMHSSIINVYDAVDGKLSSVPLEILTNNSTTHNEISPYILNSEDKEIIIGDEQYLQCKIEKKNFEKLNNKLIMCHRRTGELTKSFDPSQFLSYCFKNLRFKDFEAYENILKSSTYDISKFCSNEGSHKEKNVTRFLIDSDDLATLSDISFLKDKNSGNNNSLKNIFKQIQILNKHPILDYFTEQ